jgi:hypothetical protein
VKALNLVRAAEYDHADLVEDAIGRTLDLSHDGMRLELDHCLPLRSLVSLSLALGNQVVYLQGRVRSVTDVNGRTCEMGIEFQDLSAEAYEALDEHLLLRKATELPRRPR